MAGALKWLLLCGLSVAGIVVAGESLNDPLRPSATPATVGGDNAKAAGGSRLTSILKPVGKDVLPSAVIDGKLVKVGDRVGEAKVLRITAQKAVLQGPEGRETLSLTPGVEKKVREDKKASGRRKERQ